MCSSVCDVLKVNTSFDVSTDDTPDLVVSSPWFRSWAVPYPTESYTSNRSRTQTRLRLLTLERTHSLTVAHPLSRLLTQLHHSLSCVPNQPPALCFAHSLSRQLFVSLTHSLTHSAASMQVLQLRRAVDGNDHLHERSVPRLTTH